MMNHRSLRIVGLLVWIAAGFAAIAAIPRPSKPNPDYSLSGYLSGPSQRVIAQDPTMRLRANDPIFYQRAGGQWTQIGYVNRRMTDANDAVEIAWYTDSITPDACHLELFENDGSLESMVATMLPPEKRQQIQRRLAKSFEDYGDELTAAFIPLVEQTLERSMPVIGSCGARALHGWRQKWCATRC